MISIQRVVKEVDASEEEVRENIEELCERGVLRSPDGMYVTYGNPISIIKFVLTATPKAAKNKILG